MGVNWKDLRYPLISAVLGTTCAAIGRSDERPSGLDATAFDRSVRVQDDLYQAVNGRWLKDTPIPADRSNFGAFSILEDVSLERIRAIVEDAAATTQSQGSELQKIGDGYRSFMDEDQLLKKGVTPLAEQVRQIRDLSSKEAVWSYFGQLQGTRVMTPVALFVSQDDKDSSRYLTTVIQSGTTLPDRDYYLVDDEKFESARQAYRDYVNQLLQLRGEPTGNAADELLALEKRIAEVQWENTELRDAEKRYNKVSLDELQKRTPQCDWSAYFAKAQLADISEVNVATPSYFEGLQKILAEVPLATWKQYLEFQLFDAYAEFLPPDFEQAHFELHSRVLAGVPEQKPRWKRGVEWIAGAGAGDFGILGDAVGKLYVERHFSPDAKARMDQLVANLLTAYEQSVGELTWMTDATKARAHEKLAKITTKIAYPKKWRDYSSLQVDPTDLLGNVMRSSQVEYRRMIDKLGKPVDREEWGMTPQTVNAYYNPGKNEIVFPAAILQPPFFDAKADDAVNYGGIGAVIGHEISHAFDDQGSKYDGEGNLKNWWTPRDRHEFQGLTKQLIDQYSEYQPLPGKHVNGELTLGENIADLSGLSIAYKAYQLALAGKTPPELDGWTGDQRFFLGWSQVWRRNYREAEMIRRLLVDPHAPSWYRANGPVINIDAFYEAFHVQPTDALYRPPDKRIRIW